MWSPAVCTAGASFTCSLATGTVIAPAATCPCWISHDALLHAEQSGVDLGPHRPAGAVLEPHPLDRTDLLAPVVDHVAVVQSLNVRLIDHGALPLRWLSVCPREVPAVRARSRPPADRATVPARQFSRVSDSP